MASHSESEKPREAIGGSSEELLPDSRRDYAVRAFTPQQLALADTLGELDQRLRPMYQSAVMVLSSGVDDRLALAAHGIRELMEKLPRYIDAVPFLTSSALRYRVSELRNQFRPLQRLMSNGSLPNPEDATMQRKVAGFLATFHDFSDWYESEALSRKETAAQLLDFLEPSEAPIPEPTRDYLVSKWDEFDLYFIGVSHHRTFSSNQEFAARLTEFENFLLQRLQPRPIADMAAIDLLLNRGPDAN